MGSVNTHIQTHKYAVSQWKCNEWKSSYENLLTEKICLFLTDLYVKTDCYSVTLCKIYKYPHANIMSNKETKKYAVKWFWHCAE